MVFNDILLSIAASNIPVVGEIGRKVFIWATDAMTTDELAEFFSNEGAAAEGGALEGVGNMIHDYGGGVYTLGQDAVLYIAGTVCLIVGGSCMVFGQNANKMSDIKSGAGNRVMGAGIAFGALGILSFIMGVATKFFQ